MPLKLKGRPVRSLPRTRKGSAPPSPANARHRAAPDAPGLATGRTARFPASPLKAAKGIV
jgi:hypothetical protein